MNEFTAAIRRQTKDRKEVMDTLPKREWVGLTFDDETECLAAGNAHGWKGVMKKTEEKLKEKNT